MGLTWVPLTLASTQTSRPTKISNPWFGYTPWAAWAWNTPARAAAALLASTWMWAWGERAVAWLPLLRLSRPRDC